MAVQQLLAAYGGVTGPSDPHFAYVKSLLHFDGPDFGGTFTDVTGKTWTSGSNTTHARTSTTQSKFGGSSLYVSGDPLGYIRCTDAGLTIGTADFTIESWVYRTASGTSIIMDMRPDSTNGIYPALYHDSSGNIHAFVNNADVIAGASGGAALNTWTHVEWSRVSGSSRLFVGGVQHGSTYADSNNYLFGRLTLGVNGYDPSTGTNFVGYRDDFRLTVGVGRHSANFTPPTAAHPNF